MTQKDKELLLKDLCARLPYSIKLHHYQGADCTLKYFNPITFATYVEVKNSEYFKEFLEDGQRSLFEYKPYLRPMSSMTGEEYNKYELTFDNVVVYSGHNNNNIHSEHRATYETFDYLNSIHVDYRDLIEKGLALEAPKDMYKNI